jgi:hypothetical protein
VLKWLQGLVIEVTGKAGTSRARDWSEIALSVSEENSHGVHGIVGVNDGVEC